MQWISSETETSIPMLLQKDSIVNVRPWEGRQTEDLVSVLHFNYHPLKQDAAISVAPSRPLPRSGEHG